MTTDRIPQAAEKYIVRFPDGMRDRIAEAAKQNNRSMNAEVVARLQASFDPALSADGLAARELADSRAQTIRAMVFIQQSLCEAVLRMYATLKPTDRRDRHFEDAVGLADGLLEGARPAEYLLARAEMKEANPALAQKVEDTLADIDADSKRVHVSSVRPRRTNVAKR